MAEKLLLLFKMALARTLKEGVSAAIDGRLSTIAKASFYSLVSVISIMATGYLANVETRFAAIQETLQTMSSSIVELNRAMATSVERGEGQQKILEMQARLLQNVERRVHLLEEQKKETRK